MKAMHSAENWPYLRSRAPGRNRCQQIDGAILSLPVFFLVVRVLFKALVDPCAHDVRGLRFVPAANQRLKYICRSLSASSQIGSRRRHCQIQTDKLQRVIFELLDVMFPKSDIRDYNAFYKR